MCGISKRNGRNDRGGLGSRRRGYLYSVVVVALSSQTMIDRGDSVNDGSRIGLNADDSHDTTWHGFHVPS